MQEFYNDNYSCKHTSTLIDAASAWFSFGADLDLTKEGQESLHFQQAMQGFFGLLSRFSEAIPIYKIFPTPLYNNIKQAVLQVQGLGKKYMEQNRWRVEVRKKEGGSTEGLSLLEQWMLEGNLTEEEITILSVGMLAAGTDTVSIDIRVHTIMLIMSLLYIIDSKLCHLHAL